MVGQLETLDRGSVKILYDWIESYIDYLYRRKIITKDEKDSLIQFVNNLNDIIKNIFD